MPIHTACRRFVRAGTAESKKTALAAAGVTISDSPAEIGATTERVLRERGLL